MPKGTQKSGTTHESAKQNAPKPAAKKPEQPLDELVQHARQAPEGLTQRDVLQLQRTLGNQAVARMLTDQRQADGVHQTVDSPSKVLQRTKGKEDVGEKKKGEDYCNNIGKSIANVDTLLPGFSNTAITTSIRVINENRPKCAVSSFLVKGPDANTKAYSEFVEKLNAITEKIKLLLNETDFQYAQKQVDSFSESLTTLLDTIPAVAVDARVAEVVRNGQEGESTSLKKIDDELEKLRDALQARFKEFISTLLKNIELNAKDKK